ncbi:hypothetical protein B0H17DRAFT_1082032 [Mycena rosella]|uniref:Uncharacterized protein n=1 Tax=Mycena rosella TaxID=1033263 RepID=A0AAD7D215_MYCRO|nr:hypothetical protein B0H17DRAFT_1082032 [Mycena rosella]
MSYSAPTNATPDARAGQVLVIRGELESDDHLNMAGPPLTKGEFVVVPDLIVCKTKPAHDPDSASSESGDDISIHLEGPAETELNDESLSSSALTAATSTDDATATEDPDPYPYPTPRRSRVRFRSRVRITSGLPHQRRLSAASSRSSSPSSSISAPLRAPPTADNCSPGWGTLGTRVGLFAYSNRQAAALARSAKQRGRRRQREDAGGADERTALLGDSLAPPGYDGCIDPEDEDGYFSSDDDAYDEEAVLSRQIDLVFGTWPGRLLNRQWWWWQLQPILSCGCLDEPYED